MSSKELRKGFTPSYFSMEDILASHARVPCKTEVGITKFGFLDPGQESKNLPPNCQIELPLWAARAMSMQSRGFVSVKMPKYYNEKFSEILKADPTVVDLNKMGPQYYQTGLQLCTLPNDEAEFMAEILPEVLQRRVIAMNDAYALNRELKSTDNIGVSEIGTMLRSHYMDPLESKLFNDSRSASQELDKWLRGG